MPAFGVAMYATLALLILAEPLGAASLARLARYVVAGISAAGFLFSLYLTGVAAFILHAWCTWCTISAVTVTVIFVLAIVDAFRSVPYPGPSVALSTVRRHFAVLVIMVVAGVPAFFVLARHGTPPPPALTASAQAVAERLVRPDSHITGNPEAPVTVVEFGDFECPACSTAEETAREIRRKYGSQIRFVFRQFPLTGIHREALKAAEASECAAEQGKFWEAVEKLYHGQSDLSEPALVRYASELGLDKDRFVACLASRSTTARVRRDVEDARALGLRATPTFFVGRQVIEGPLELGQFARLIEQELASHRPPLPGPGTSAVDPARVAEPRARPSAAETRPAGNSSFASGGLLAGGGTSIFTQFPRSATACSEEEAQGPQPALIRTTEAREFFASGPNALFVDVRPAADFKKARIPGAINVPADEIEGRWKSLPSDKSIVLYESGRSPGDVCAASRAAGRVLLAHGFAPERVKVYQDGLAGWEKASLPVER